MERLSPKEPLETICRDDERFLAMLKEMQNDALDKLERSEASEKIAILDGAISKIKKYLETCSLSAPFREAAIGTIALLEAKKKNVSEHSRRNDAFVLNEKTGRYEISGERIMKSGKDFFAMFPPGQKPYKIKVWRNGEPLSSSRTGQQMVFEWEERVGQYFYRATPLYFRHSKPNIANKYEVEIVSTKERFSEGWDENISAKPYEQGAERFEKSVKGKRSALPERQRAKSESEISETQKASVIGYVKQCEQQLKLSKNQYIMVVDKNEKIQRAYIVYYDASAQTDEARFRIMGADAVSAGNTLWEKDRKSEDEDHYYETPSGHFLLEGKMYYKWAARDRNIFNFGRQIAYMENKKFERILFGIHPVSEKREKRLGERASHGCIRISSEMYDFLEEENFLGDEMKVLLVFDSGQEREKPDTSSRN